MPHKPTTALDLLTHVTNSTVVDLCDLAIAGEWSDSLHRLIAVGFAGARPRMADRKFHKSRPCGVWMWIEALDAVELRAQGLQINVVAECLGIANGLVLTSSPP